MGNKFVKTSQLSIVKSYIDQKDATKQDVLVSGTNIKTINNESVLGSGNISITGGVWGQITGTLSDQADLNTSLSNKQDKTTAVTHTASTAAGSGTQPVYVNASGVATPTTYALNKTVPSDAVFTDTVYTHPAGSGASLASKLYKFSTDSTSHISGVTEVAKGDITALGIPAQDTTYEDATTSVHGLMSTTDKTKLDEIQDATDAEVQAYFPIYTTLTSSAGAFTVDDSIEIGQSMIVGGVQG